MSLIIYWIGRTNVHKEKRSGSFSIETDEIVENVNRCKPKILAQREKSARAFLSRFREDGDYSVTLIVTVDEMDILHQRWIKTPFNAIQFRQHCKSKKLWQPFYGMKR